LKLLKNNSNAGNNGGNILWHQGNDWRNDYFIFYAYYLNSYYSGRLIDYPMKEQVLDILPLFLITVLMGLIVYFTGIILQTGNTKVADTTCNWFINSFCDM